MAYEPIARERFTIEQGVSGEQIRIPAPRQIFVMLFLPVWLAGWTVGGAVALSTLLKTFQPFLLFWLCFWAAGWLFAASTIAWMFFGSETLRIVGGDLEVTKRLLGWSPRKLFRGGDIRHLRAAVQLPGPYRFYWQTPFFWRGQGGAVQFDYGARTVYVAAGLDEAEGRRIVERLAGQLPASAR
jgi:hypothetical protein